MQIRRAIAVLALILAILSLVGFVLIPGALPIAVALLALLHLT